MNGRGVRSSRAAGSQLAAVTHSISIVLITMALYVIYMTHLVQRPLNGIVAQGEGEKGE